MTALIPKIKITILIILIIVTGSLSGEQKKKVSNGWCCTNGKVVKSTKAECRKAGGQFFKFRKKALQNCTSSPEKPASTIDPSKTFAGPEVNTMDQNKTRKQKPTISKGNQGPVKGYRVIQKTDYWAILEVDYEYNPPKGNQAYLRAEVYQKGGYIIGKSSVYDPGYSLFITENESRIGISNAAKGKAIIPVSISPYKILRGEGSPPGNMSSDIILYLGEKDIEKELKSEFKFEFDWGSDGVYNVQVSRKSKNQFEVTFWFIHDLRRYPVFNSSTDSLRQYIFDITPYLDGKVVSGNTLYYTRGFHYATDQPWFRPFRLELTSSSNSIDEIMVKVKYKNDEKNNKEKYTFYKKKFKVNLD